MAGMNEYDQVNLKSPMGPTATGVDPEAEAADIDDADTYAIKNPVRVTILIVGFFVPVLTELIMHMVYGSEWEKQSLVMSSCWHMGAALCAGVISSGAVRVLCNIAASWYFEQSDVYIHSWFHQGDGKVKAGRIVLLALGPVVLVVIEIRDAVAGASIEGIDDARHILETLCIATLLVELLQVICNAFVALKNKDMDLYVNSFNHLNDKVPEVELEQFGKIKVVLSCIAFAIPPSIDLLEHVGAGRPEFYWFILEILCQATILSLIGALSYDTVHAHRATGMTGVYEYAVQLIQSGFIQILLEAGDENDHEHNADLAPRQNEGEQLVELAIRGAGAGLEEQDLTIGVGPNSEHSMMDDAPDSAELARAAQMRIATGTPLKSPPSAAMLQDERMLQLREFQQQRRAESKAVDLMDTEGGKNFALSSTAVETEPTAAEAKQ